MPQVNERLYISSFCTPGSFFVDITIQEFTLMILSWGFVEFEGCQGLGFSNLMKQHFDFALAYCVCLPNT